MIEDRRDWPSNGDDAAEPLAGGETGHAWPTAGHAPPGVDYGGHADGYDYGPTGYDREWHDTPVAGGPIHDAQGYTASADQGYTEQGYGEQAAPDFAGPGYSGGDGYDMYRRDGGGTPWDGAAGLPRQPAGGTPWDGAVTSTGAHAADAGEDYDEQRYGAPTERYAALADLAYAPGQVPAHAAPDDDFPNQDYPQQDFAQDGYPQQDFAQDGYPQQGFAQGGFPQQEFPGHDFSGHDLSGQNFPGRGFPQDDFAGAGPDTAVVEQVPGQLIDLSKPRPLPATHRGQRRKLVGVLSVAAIATVLAGGAGYAIFRPDPSGHPAAADPAVTSTAAPTGTTDSLLDGAPLPSADPLKTSASPSPSVSTSSTPSATPTTKPATRAPEPPTVPLTPSPRATTSRPAVAPTVAPSPPDAPLTASFSSNGGDPGALKPYIGTVRISNSRSSAVSGWTVRLTVPGGGDVTVRSGDVSVSQNGESVSFRGAPVPGDGSLTFSFSVTGTMSSNPSGCSVDGNACS